ncbi:hypothetical protein A3L04_01970 [Thermococcus chitonophagus]|uniref:DUF835 domain-containing protein n=1 Tax=Thermococcus chitonophagus TaxID=54262 RepID=A0A160VR04_9EURY|nr:DUF835 domain-containing protein [Thermococcus chitonophagus]ASJ15927.1 hypothetical protein A3L04_01970 [Thermococcus chitonophagus]CUX77170.1 hypothetical protein CHITON_0391 [Thermococcus chitonophagus]
MVSWIALSYRVLVFLIFLALAIYSTLQYVRSPSEFKSLFRNSIVFFTTASGLRLIDILYLYLKVPYYNEIHTLGHIVILLSFAWIYISFTRRLTGFFYPEEPKITGVHAYLATSLLEVEGLLEGEKILAITRNPSTYDKYDAKVVWVTTAEGTSGVSPTALHVILDLAIRFAQENRGGVVVIDCVEFLILYNGFKATYKFLTSLKDHLITRNSKLIVVLNPQALDEKEWNLLRREFVQPQNVPSL